MARLRMFTTLAVCILLTSIGLAAEETIHFREGGSGCRARVEIGNKSNYASFTDLAICGPTSWSSSSITAKCNVGGLGGGDWRLSVVNASGLKSTGYRVN